MNDPQLSCEVAQLEDPVLDQILDFCAESGLLVIIHDDTFAKAGGRCIDAMVSLVQRHPATTFIWARTAAASLVGQLRDHAPALEVLLTHVENLYFDLCWEEVASEIVASPECLCAAAALVQRFPDRFLFGMKTTGSPTERRYLKLLRQCGPLWELLGPEVGARVRSGNHQRLVCETKQKLRAWEVANLA